jgi:para-nitrobenzyl esterase
MSKQRSLPGGLDLSTLVAQNCEVDIGAMSRRRLLKSSLVTGAIVTGTALPGKLLAQNDAVPARRGLQRRRNGYNGPERQPMKRIFLLCIALTPTFAIADSGPVVTVTGGQVRGAMLAKGGAVFKAIPYAQAPVGDLRWREPMPVKPWTGLRDATAFGAICAQTSFLIARAAEVSKEDCLFLNVWTPAWPSKARKPVMVWIPGGGNFAGGNTGVFDDGERLARHGLVLVSLNYRLGSFGFFSHPALTHESPHHSSGNQGILDQIAALKWVRDNIARFGGDPSNVTIFGESAGSLDVSVLMTSPLSKGLFRRVIGESGAVILVGDPLTLAEAEKRGETFAAHWNVPANASAKDLRAVSTDDILKAEPNYLQGAIAPAFPNLGVTIDGFVFPKQPAAVFAAGQEHRVGLLLGSNSRERIPGSTPPEDLVTAIKDAYGPIAERAQALYVGAADPLYGRPADQWATDSSFRCAAVAQLAWHAAAGNPAFEYEFARVPTGRETVGATHASEVSYVFGTIDKGIILGGGPPAQMSDVDRQVSDVMQQYWTAFAKTGYPRGDQLPTWSKFDAASRAYIQFTDSGPIVKEGLRRPFCDLFIENVKRHMASAVQ